MVIIPVLDLMKGLVVQGVRGEREKYRPLQTILSDTPNDPASVARGLHAETGSNTFYLADLDAIQNQGSHQAIIQNLGDEPGFDIWVDAGAADVTSARRVLEYGADQVIIGAETVPHFDALHDLQHHLPQKQMVFSLDIVSGQVISKSAKLKGQDPLAVLDMLARTGWSKIIILTLDRVGTGQGLDWDLLHAARKNHPQLTLIAGGGVRTPAELQKLAALEIDGVLVASALHKGWITRQNLLNLNLL